MRVLLAAIGLATLFWGGYWYLGAQATEKALIAWLDDRRDEGWQADASSIKTRGFPNRFDTTLTGLQLADPATGVSWTSPFFQILSLSYKPNHVITVFPQAHSVSTPEETIQILSAGTRGSVVLEPNSLLALDRSSFETENLNLSSTKGWDITAQTLKIATRKNSTESSGYDIAVGGSHVVPGGSWSSIARDAGLPDEIAGLSLDATVGFDGPWDRLAIERSRPQPTSLNLKILRAEWGDLLFQATGKLDIDALGTPTGSIAIQAQNWREMLELGVTTGAVKMSALPTIENVLALLAGISGNPKHIDATLNFSRGFIALGPVPIGRAPTLRIR